MMGSDWTWLKGKHTSSMLPLIYKGVPLPQTVSRLGGPMAPVFFALSQPIRGVRDRKEDLRMLPVPSVNLSFRAKSQLINSGPYQSSLLLALSREWNDPCKQLLSFPLRVLLGSFPHSLLSTSKFGGWSNFFSSQFQAQKRPSGRFLLHLFVQVFFPGSFLRFLAGNVKIGGPN